MELEIITIVVAMTTHLIFLFKRELLIGKKSKKLIWIGSGILFIIVLIIGPKYNQIIKSLPLLMLPFLSFVIFNILLVIYRKLYKENPKDTFWTFDIRLMKSGVFNFIFWVVGILVPVYISYKLIG